MNTREINSNPFHPLFAAVNRRVAKTKDSTIINDANSKVALVNHAEQLLSEIFNKSEKSVVDYKTSKEYLKKAYDSVSWFSYGFLGKLYAGFELRALLSTPLDGFVNLAELNDGVKQNGMFKNALELLNDAKLIELKDKNIKVKVTDKGREYLHIIKEVS